MSILKQWKRRKDVKIKTGKTNSRTDFQNCLREIIYIVRNQDSDFLWELLLEAKMKEASGLKCLTKLVYPLKE